MFVCINTQTFCTWAVYLKVKTRNTLTRAPTYSADAHTTWLVCWSSLLHTILFVKLPSVPSAGSTRDGAR